MCVPLMKTFGTVRCPVIFAKYCWIAAPSETLSSSTTSYSTPASERALFAVTQYGQYVLLKTVDPCRRVSTLLLISDMFAADDENIQEPMYLWWRERTTPKRITCTLVSTRVLSGRRAH